MIHKGSASFLLLSAAAVGALTGLAAKPRLPSFYTPLVEMPQPFCGLYAVVTLASLKGVATDLGTVKHHVEVDQRGTSVLDCLQALHAIGVKCHPIAFESITDLPELAPMLCIVRADAGFHAVVVIRNGDRVLIIDGNETQPMACTAFDSVAERIAVVPEAD